MYDNMYIRVHVRTVSMRWKLYQNWWFSIWPLYQNITQCWYHALTNSTLYTGMHSFLVVLQVWILVISFIYVHTLCMHAMHRRDNTFVQSYLSLCCLFSGLFLNSGFWGWLSIESQPQNPELGRLLWLLWFNFSLSEDNWPFKLKFVDIYSHTASFRIWFSKVQDFGIFELSPISAMCQGIKTRISYAVSIQRYCRCSKILNTSCLPKGPRQTVKSQVRLLLKKQSEQVLLCLLFRQAFCELQPW